MRTPNRAASGIALDVLHAFRTLRRSPGFTTVAVATLAVGIGANVAIFRIADALLRRPLPVRDPSELVLLGEARSWGMLSGQTGSFQVFSAPYVRRLEARTDLFSGVFATQSTRPEVPIRIPGSPSLEGAGIELVTGSAFRVLGVGAAAGRILQPEDDRPGAAPVVVISHGFWMRRFAGSPDVVGGTVDVGDTPFRIVGVAARGFSGVAVDERAPDLWIPLARQPEALRRPNILARSGLAWLNVMARLRPGVSRARASAALTADLRAWLRADPEAAKDVDAAAIDRCSVAVNPGARGISHLRREYGQSLSLLSALVGFVLLLACANAASLAMARATYREREIAIRAALGAGRGRLASLFFTESLAIGLVGGVAGTFVGAVLGPWIARRVSTGMRETPAFALDPRTLLFTLFLAVGAGLLFGLAPFLRSWREVSRSGAVTLLRTAAGTSAGRSRWTKTIVVAEVAIALPLMIAAGLVGRSLANLLSEPTGFLAEHVLSARLQMPPAASPAERDVLYGRLEERLRRSRGASSAGLALYGPLSGENWVSEIVFPGRRLSRDDAFISWDRASPGYFRTLGIAIAAGRGFEERDGPASPRVAVVNRAFARRYFGSASPLGARFDFAVPGRAPGIEIVGVVGDARFESVRENPQPMFFLPLTQNPADANFGERESTSIHEAAVRFGGAAGPAIGEVRRIIAEVDPRILVARAEPLLARRSESISREILVGGLAAGLGGLAMFLAAVGVAGVMSFLSARRTSEFGVRLALGATGGAIQRQVLGETLAVVAAGAAAGVALTGAGLGLLRHELFGVGPADPAVWGAVVVLLAAMALAAGWLPARRAARVDPIAALRQE